MTIDRILLLLRIPPDPCSGAGHGALELGRSGFFAWLMSLPHDRDVAGQATLALSRVASSGSATPATAVLSDLLERAARESSMSAAPTRSGVHGGRHRRRRRAIH